MNTQSLLRHFEAARLTVAALRKREATLRNRLAMLAPASLDWRRCRAELLDVEGGLARARGSMGQRRRELERAEKETETT